MIFKFRLNSYMVHGYIYSCIKGAVCDPGESLLTFELNSQTNKPLPSELLQNAPSQIDGHALPRQRALINPNSIEKASILKVVCLWSCRQT